MRVEEASGTAGLAWAPALRVTEAYRERYGQANGIQSFDLPPDLELPTLSVVRPTGLRALATSRSGPL